MGIEGYFWLAVVVKMLLSFPIQLTSVKRLSPTALSLSSSQRKDDWLAIGVMAVLTAGERHDFTGPLYVALRDFYASLMGPDAHLISLLHLAGVVVILWLISRTLARLKLLKTQR